MSAYAMRQREQSGPLAHLESARPEVQPVSSRASTEAGSAFARGVDRVGLDETSIIDALLDRFIDRLAAAVVARIGTDRADHTEEWLDSRQAAEYLGLHRDTLRRLAAAREIPAEQDGRGCKLSFRRTALDEWRSSGGRVRHLAALADAA